MLINDKAEEYARHFTTALDPLRATIESDTLADHAHAHMLSGHVQGKVLEALSCMINPAKILEVGTFTGFSALCLAKGLQAGGELHTIELRQEDAGVAQRYFDESSLKDQVTLHTGNALDIIPTLNHEWELVFLDADKVNYINYYELTLPKLKAGGWIIADNVLFHGEVLADPISGKNAKAIHAFNVHVSNDPRVQQTMLTVRDGLMIIQKL